MFLSKNDVVFLNNGLVKFNNKYFCIIKEINNDTIEVVDIKTSISYLLKNSSLYN